MSLEHTIMQECMEVLKNKWANERMSEWMDESQPEGAPTGQIQDSLSTKVIKDSNKLWIIEKIWDSPDPQE